MKTKWRSVPRGTLYVQCMYQDIHTKLSKVNTHLELVIGQGATTKPGNGHTIAGVLGQKGNPDDVA